MKRKLLDRSCSWTKWQLRRRSRKWRKTFSCWRTKTPSSSRWDDYICSWWVTHEPESRASALSWDYVKLWHNLFKNKHQFDFYGLLVKSSCSILVVCLKASSPHTLILPNRRKSCWRTGSARWPPSWQRRRRKQRTWAKSRTSRRWWWLTWRVRDELPAPFCVQE